MDLKQEFRIEDVSDPYYAEPESAGGMSCPAGETGDCEHNKAFQHSVGVSQSISGQVSTGLNLADILDLGLAAGFEYSWSTEEAVADSATVVCPDPEGGVYDCGIQVRPQMIKTKGKVHKYYSDECPSFDDQGFVDFEVVAPYLDKGGANQDANAVASFEACIRSCPKSTDSLDCEGVKNALDKGVPLCPDVARKHDFKEGWCTAHIIQRQRWQGAVGDRFKFDLQIWDGEGNDIYHELHQEVDEHGLLSVKSLLPYTIEIQTTGEDNDDVGICYADQCFSCDGNDGGDHHCTLGNGDENGYEDGDRGHDGWDRAVVKVTAELKVLLKSSWLQKIVASHHEYRKVIVEAMFASAVRVGDLDLVSWLITEGVDPELPVQMTGFRSGILLEGLESGDLLWILRLRSIAS
ncbi:uncharacterized protein DNG_10456 [Cephalotrichum gorgonifer]|uniref:Uncharacterized protein n=1 Tax=Cephalotrichum gorgonifer TaxID=2041049 RepID=A0AAE8N7Q6_9PEZI|nr:uncharacterized protein DNG_10456 [Cephalotrichum gorgonifer]